MMKMVTTQMRECTMFLARQGEEGCRYYLVPHREVYQVEIKVVQLQCSEALLACYLNQGPLVECVP